MVSHIVKQPKVSLVERQRIWDSIQKGLFNVSTKVLTPTVACQKFKYNFTHFKDCHVISSICYTVYSKDSLFNSLKIAVIKHRVVLKDNYMRLNHMRL